MQFIWHVLRWLFGAFEWYIVRHCLSSNRHFDIFLAVLPPNCLLENEDRVFFFFGKQNEDRVFGKEHGDFKMKKNWSIFEINAKGNKNIIENHEN